MVSTLTALRSAQKLEGEKARGGERVSFIHNGCAALAGSSQGDSTTLTAAAKEVPHHGHPTFNCA
jgi:hypothetical protein